MLDDRFEVLLCFAKHDHYLSLVAKFVLSRTSRCLKQWKNSIHPLTQVI